MAKRTWRAFQPEYEPGTYTRIGVQRLTDEQLAKEYSRVRREVTERVRSFRRSSDIEVKRHAAFLAEYYGVSGFMKYGEMSNYPTLKQIREYAGGIDPKKGGGRALMEDLLIEGYRYASAKTSSVSGFNAMRDKQVNALQAAGYDFVNRGNLRQFGEFMDYFRDRKDSKSFGSGTVAKAFSMAAKKGINPKQLEQHFKFYVNQVKGGAEELTSFRDRRR